MYGCRLIDPLTYFNVTFFYPIIKPSSYCQFKNLTSVTLLHSCPKVEASF
jgi:hypothetical protein